MIYDKIIKKVFKNQPVSKSLDDMNKKELDQELKYAKELVDNCPYKLYRKDYLRKVVFKLRRIKRNEL